MLWHTEPESIQCVYGARQLTICFFRNWSAWVENTESSHKLVKANHIILLGIKQLKNLHELTCWHWKFEWITTSCGECNRHHLHTRPGLLYLVSKNVAVILSFK